MKTLISTICLIFLLACQPKTSTDQASDSTQVDAFSDTVANPATEEHGETASPPTLENEILLRANTVVYVDTISGEDMGQRALLEKVTLLSTTTLRYPKDADLCDQYLMYEVRFPDDQSTGWVSGADVMMAFEDDNAYIGDVMYHGKSYQIFYAYDTGIGPSDSNGLTGCNSYKIPYFLESGNNTVQLITFSIPVSPSGLIDSYDTWFSLISSEGGDASIVGTESVGDEILFNLDISYQEGGERVTVHINQQDGKFVATLAEKNSEDTGD